MSAWRDKLSRGEQEKLEGKVGLWLDMDGEGSLPVVATLRGPLLPWQKGKLADLGLSLDGGRAAHGSLTAAQLVAAADWGWIQRVEASPDDSAFAPGGELSSPPDPPETDGAQPSTDSAVQRSEGS